VKEVVAHALAGTAAVTGDAVADALEAGQLLDVKMEQFARLETLLPTDTHGKPRDDDRRVISGIVHVLKSGGRWVDTPETYGPRKTRYNRFVRWAAKGAFGSTSSTPWPQLAAHRRRSSSTLRS
jgi:hypothetical protein